MLRMLSIDDIMYDQIATNLLKFEENHAESAVKVSEAPSNLQFARLLALQPHCLKCAKLGLSSAAMFSSFALHYCFQAMPTLATVRILAYWTVLL